MLLDTTEVLACPECGPPTGLILRIDEAEDRRVVRGELACPFCAGRFEIRDGRAELGDHELASSTDGPGDDTLLIAALADLGQSVGFVLLDPALSVAADRLASLAPGIEILSLIPTRTSDRGGPLPVLDGRLAAAAVRAGSPYAAAELARVIRVGGRLAVLGGGSAERWTTMPRFRVLASDERAIVLLREG